MGDDDLSQNYDTINLHRRGPAATIELNRPDRMNAWSDRLSLDLLTAIREVADDPQVRAVLITGAGRGFSSGADLKEGAARAGDGKFDPYQVLTERYHPIITGIRFMPKPVVAAVNGAAAGIGASLALACDLVVAAESAYFSFAFVNIGLVPDGGSSLLVPSRVGFARAAELAILGERLPARDALDWGLINRVVAAEQLESSVLELVESIARSSPYTVATGKRAFYTQIDRSEHDAYERCEVVMTENSLAHDAQEGMSAFLEKRPPVWRGD